MQFVGFLRFIFGIMLTYPFVRLALSHETRSKKLTNQLLQQKSHPFRRAVFAPEVLSKNWAPFASFSIYELPSTQQPVFSHRDAGTDLPGYPGVGANRNLSLLKENGVFQYLTGLPTYPNPTTLRRFLLRMGPLGSSQIEEAPRPVAFIHDSEAESSDQGDLRSGLDRAHPLWQTGDGSDRLRILEKRGRPSYHPLLCFNGITKDFWHGELRPGDTHTAAGTVELLKAVFAKLPPSVKIVIIRADKGFYDHETIGYLESKRAFVIVARLTAPVKRTISTLSYQVHSSGLETAKVCINPRSGRNNIALWW